MIHIHQINLQPAVGGGEVYTRWFTRALEQAGASVTLYVDQANGFWDGLATDRITVVGVRDGNDIVRRLPEKGALIVTQSGISGELHEVAARDHVLTGFAHMPMIDRSASGFARYAAVFTVSAYCVGLLRKAGIRQVYQEPMYGTYQLDRAAGAGVPIRAASPYHWDRRKGRDRLYSMLEPLARTFLQRPVFVRKPGLTLGIVSLLSPIKQFPALFAVLAPVIARFPQVNLEVFGNGGYAQVRDLRRSLAPLARKVRFWGYQSAVQSIYPNLDYLMTGLPEKEALGLNALEAQALGTPVLAPDAPPFTETVLDGRSGFLYRDPRLDGGSDFAGLLASLVDGRPRPDPRDAQEHLAKFSFDAMVGRTRAMLAFLEREFPQARG
ncbi:MAG: glycosyltransferase family 4 protein [Proteobacteria bacterium]|nr:glycosyltransferase family 4 protein [Pseudomonadota bacterium]